MKYWLLVVGLFLCLMPLHSQKTPIMTGTDTPVNLGIPCDQTMLNVMFYNTASGIGRPIWICNGTIWGQASVAISSATASFGGSALIAAPITSTVTVTGAVTGAPCIVSRADGTVLPVGLTAECSVISGVATVTVKGTGLPPAGSYNLRIFN